MAGVRGMEGQEGMPWALLGLPAWARHMVLTIWVMNQRVCASVLPQGKGRCTGFWIQGHEHSHLASVHQAPQPTQM